eukprot:891872-Pyramimonas_sp.AAC.1
MSHPVADNPRTLQTLPPSQRRRGSGGPRALEQERFTGSYHRDISHGVTTGRHVAKRRPGS